MGTRRYLGANSPKVPFVIRAAHQGYRNVPRAIQTSERLSSLYLIQRQIGASHNAYFKFYLSKKDGCIGNSVVCKVSQEEDNAVAMSWFSYSIKSFGVLELNAMGPDWGWTWGLGFDNSNSRACLYLRIILYVRIRKRLFRNISSHC